LVVDADRVEPLAVAEEGFQAVSRRDPEVDEFVGGVEHVELANRGWTDVRWDSAELGAALAVKEGFGSGVAERDDHPVDVSSFTVAVQA
jgi:hypothetical protein